MYVIHMNNFEIKRLQGQSGLAIIWLYVCYVPIDCKKMTSLNVSSMGSRLSKLLKLFS